MISTVRTKHLLEVWISHLVLCATGAAPRRTLIVGRKEDDAHAIELDFVEDARGELERLIALYRAGLRMPLPYLHDPAQQLVDKLAKGEELPSALAAAASKALPAARGRPPSDGDDAHVRQVFSLRQLEAIGSLSARDENGEVLDFATVAQRLLTPLERHKREKGA